MQALIIDDSAIMRKVIERALRQAAIGLTGFLEAPNGAEAIAMLRAGTVVDLILTDINMPVLDGLGFLEARRNENLAPQTPVVIISSEGSEPLVLRAIKAGARGYLCKPFTPEQVRARLLPLLTPAA